MNKEQIKQAINTLIMVTGDCPYERGIGEDNIDCNKYNHCIDCWKRELGNELDKILKEEN